MALPLMDMVPSLIANVKWKHNGRMANSMEKFMANILMEIGTIKSSRMGNNMENGCFFGRMAVDGNMRHLKEHTMVNIVSTEQMEIFVRRDCTRIIKLFNRRCMIDSNKKLNMLCTIIAE